EQLENESSGAEERIRDHVVPCLGNLALAAGRDFLWKPLHYHILLKARHPSYHVRLHAIAASRAVMTKLGPDGLVLLPDAMPFYSELLEDEHVEVEEAAQRLIRDLETSLGEDLQQYF
ncbi:unnamed protein product, partial [Darwinula stevensoni]